MTRSARCFGNWCRERTEDTEKEIMIRGFLDPRRHGSIIPARANPFTELKKGDRHAASTFAECPAFAAHGVVVGLFVAAPTVARADLPPPEGMRRRFRQITPLLF